MSLSDNSEWMKEKTTLENLVLLFQFCIYVFHVFLYPVIDLAYFADKPLHSSYQIEISNRQTHSHHHHPIIR